MAILLLREPENIAIHMAIYVFREPENTILSRKTCDGEQKLFSRINLHVNANMVIKKIFADWTVFC